VAARTRTRGRRDAILSSAGGLPPDGPRRGLIAACLRGDRDAWEELVRSHAGLVYTVLRRCGLGEDEADDLFQDVWVAAWDGLARVRDERALPGWLATIAARTGTRALRRRVRHRVVGGEAYEDAVTRAPDLTPSPELAVLARERDESVRAAIASLSERDRLLVHAFFYDPATPSYAEIAARLGVSPETVGPMRTRCLLRLRRALGDRLGRTGTDA
jgi:RNA polymerase sigma factor (sigma-70 family)